MTQKGVEFVKQADGNLLIRLLPAGREMLEEVIAEKGRDSIGSDDTMHELFEHQLCNGWDSVSPEETGSMTDAPMFSSDTVRDDQHTLMALGDLYWFPNYQIESPVDTLFDSSEVLFTGVPQRPIDTISGRDVVDAYNGLYNNEISVTACSPELNAVKTEEAQREYADRFQGIIGELRMGNLRILSTSRSNWYGKVTRAILKAAKLKASYRTNADIAKALGVEAKTARVQ